MSARSIEEYYQHLVQQPVEYWSIDIHEHLPTLRELVQPGLHVTELGVRWGASTVAFLAGNPTALVSYDIVVNRQIEAIVELARKEQRCFSFIRGDCLSIEIAPTDILFIDTLHTYNQLSLELPKHAPSVSRLIVLHDTETYGALDEAIYVHASPIVKTLPQEKQGLKTAYLDFLDSHQGRDWKVHREYSNNNGLTILARRSVP
ncbi:hypothetical protein ACFL59_11015 [Planctomycetota bacterium]